VTRGEEVAHLPIRFLAVPASLLSASPRLLFSGRPFAPTPFLNDR